MMLMKQGVRILVLLLFTCCCNGQLSPVILEYTADDNSPGDYFGDEAAMANGTIVVTAYRRDGGNGFRSGGAYVFSAVGDGSWIQVSTLIAETPAAEDACGRQIAISGADIALGCAHDDSAAIDSGAIFMFHEGTPSVWTRVATLTPSDVLANRLFPSAVSMVPQKLAASVVYGSTDDGSTALGYVYIFEEVSPSVWQETFKLVPTGSQVGNFFGYAVSMLGSRMVVGAHQEDVAYNDAGAIWFYEETSPSVWGNEQVIIADDLAEDDRWGDIVALGNNNIFVGDYNDDEFGQLHAGHNFGAVTVFTENTLGIWQQSQKLTGSDHAINPYKQKFGYKLAVDENVLIVAQQTSFNSDHNSIYIFQETSVGFWEEQAFVNGVGYGHSTAISGSWLLTGVVGTEQIAVMSFDSTSQCPGNLCEHSTCIDAYFNYTCDCPPSHGGFYCDICLCQNGGVCDDNLETGIGYCNCTTVSFGGLSCETSCNNGIGAAGSPSCNCNGTGATGVFCENDEDDCASNPCLFGGTCEDRGVELFPTHNNEYNCTCKNKRYGDSCENTLCYSSPCMNGGSCENGVNTVCNCTGTGYSDTFCGTNIDDCLSEPCLNGGICVDKVNLVACDCSGLGYQGDFCETEVNECLSSPCQNGGTCEDKKNWYKCVCAGGFEGDACNHIVDDCLSSPCQNGGICTSQGPLNFTCNCTASVIPYSGARCEDKVDLCSFNPCEPEEECTWKQNKDQRILQSMA